MELQRLKLKYGKVASEEDQKTDEQTEVPEMILLISDSSLLNAAQLQEDMESGTLPLKVYEFQINEGMGNILCIDMNFFCIINY